MNNWVKNEWAKITAIESSAELYRIFLRGLQGVSMLGLAWALLFTLPMLFQLSSMMGEGVYYSPWLAFAFLFPFFQIAAAEFALRGIQRNKFLGTLTALILASFAIFSWIFPLAIFGYYALLNRRYQEKYLRGAPKVFREFLTAIKLNRIPEDQLQAEVAPQR